MSTAVISKFAKSKYAKRKDVFHTASDAFVLAVGLVFCGIMLINKAADNSETVTNLMMYLILGTAYLYVLSDVVYLVHKQKKTDLEQAQNGIDYVRRSVLGLIAAAFIISVLAVLAAVNGKIYSNENNYGLYIWYMAMIGLAWTDGYYVKAATLFGEDCFYSGKYKINYSDVTEIRELSKRTAGIRMHDIYLVELYCGEKLLGMDKLFSEEYIFLQNKINRVHEEGKLLPR